MLADRICALQQILYMSAGIRRTGTNTPKSTPHGLRQQDVRWHAPGLSVRAALSCSYRIRPVSWRCNLTGSGDRLLLSLSVRL